MLNSFFSFYLSVSLSLSLILPLSFSYSLMGNISLTIGNRLAFFSFFVIPILHLFSLVLVLLHWFSFLFFIFCSALLSSSSSSLLVCVVTTKDLLNPHTPNGSQTYANGVGLGQILHVGNGMEIFYMWEWNLNCFRYIKHISS